MGTPRFRVSVTKQAPLRIQLQPASGKYLEVLEADVGGEVKVGQATRPALSYPSTIGKGARMVPVCMTWPLKSATATAISVFSAAPSYPIMTLLSSGLPYMAKVEFPRHQGIMVGGSDSAILLFAIGTNTHTLSGGIEWEEI